MSEKKPSEVRYDEILSACEKLYETMTFKDVTIKEISVFTSFTRPSIYNYFQTKEEIFLALAQRGYVRWCEELEEIINSNGSLTVDEFADKIAKSLQNRKLMLKLISTNLNEMELNSRLENLTAFKAEYGRAITLLRECLDKFFPEINNKDDLMFTLLPFIYGVYPYTEVSDKQREAMETVGLEYRYMSIYEMVYMGIKKIMGGN